MTVPVGSRFGPYEIVAKLGEGGMGEVYRACDTRLDRTVAIKVLPSALAADPQLRDRFDREARAISSLSHPHICALFDVGHQDGIDFLVLEYLEGETIADRLTRLGALETSDALKIAGEVCDALDKAHRSGIVHRDLKPANVMLTKAGAKLLDFGLARNAAPIIPAASASMLPTTPPGLTSPGTILGTFQYMAPEQVEGLEADARTDIFAFGALLFEMVTGRPAFEGKTRASLLGAILKDTPPPVSSVRGVVPAALDRIVSTCLEKDPDDRYQSARDLLRDLKWAASGGGGRVAETRTEPRPASSRLAWIVAAVALLGLIAVGIVTLGRANVVPPAADPVQFTILPPDDASFGGPTAGGTGTATQLAISRDGRNIVFVAGSPQSYRLWLRPLDVQVATPIAGTDGATFPFWSPDGRSIAFFADGKLKKVALSGGPPVVLCDAPSGRGGTWNRDNVIVFSPASVAGTSLMRVSAAGGTPTPATTIDPATGETNHRWPHFLPDARHFIYTASTGACCPAEKPSTIRIGSLDAAGDAISLFEVESSVSYAVGHLLFARDEALLAQPFDAESRRTTGEAFPIAGQVGPEGSRYVSVSASENGILIYAPDSSRLPRQLTWFDRGGRVLSTLAEVPQYSNPALSPDGTRVALALGGGDPRNRQVWFDNLRSDIWLIDLERKGRSKLTVDSGMDRAPVWSPDGARIVFSGLRAGKYSLRQKVVDSTAPDEALLEGPSSGTSPTLIGLPSISPTDWSADGRYIAYTLNRTFPRRSDVWVLPLGGDRTPFAIAETSFLESAAVFAPDGRWIAYVSDEAGQPNVYVQAFPPRDKVRRQVSNDSGGQPAWRADGKELFFMRGDGTMMTAAVNTAGEIDVGVPKALFHALHPSAVTLNTAQYAVTRDGARFLVNVRPQRSEVTPLTVITNWTAAIQR